METSNNSRTFNRTALWVARSFRGLAVGDLAAATGISRQTVGSIEAGTAPPFRPAVHALAAALRFPIEFFFESSSPPDRRVFHFRKGASVPEYAVAHAMAHAAVFERITGSFSSFATFAPPRLPTAKPSDNEAIERAADAFRVAVALRPEVPIVNAVRVAEASGAFVGTFDPGVMKIHGFACVMRAPVVMLSANSPWSRRRFSAMHEIGHLVMHGGGSRPEDVDDAEGQANRFAGAVLVPRASFWREFPKPRNRQFDWAAMIAMKQRWGMSLQALVHRALDLDIIDANQYRTANVHVSRNGWRTAEPAELDVEEPELCSAFVDGLRRRSEVDELCRCATIYLDDIERILGLRGDIEEESKIIKLSGRIPRSIDPA